MFNLGNLKYRIKRGVVKWFSRQKSVKFFLYQLTIRKIIGVAFLLVMTNSLGLYLLNQKQHQVYQEMIQVYEAKDWTKLNQIRNQMNVMNAGEWSYFLEKEIQMVLDSYQNNELIYEEVRDQLNWIQSLMLLPKQMNRHQHRLEQLKVSKALFEEGLYHAKVKEWKLAKAKLSKVVKEDSNYEKAQYWLKEVERWEREEETIRSFKFYDNQRFVANS